MNCTSHRLSPSKVATVLCSMNTIDWYCKKPSPMGNLAVCGTLPNKRAKNRQHSQWRCCHGAHTGPRGNAHASNASTLIDGKTIHPTTKGALIHAKQPEPHVKAGHTLATSRRLDCCVHNHSLSHTHGFDNGCFSPMTTTALNPM